MVKEQRFGLYWIEGRYPQCQRNEIIYLTSYRLNRHVALKILKAKYYRSTKSIYKVKVLQYLKTSDLTHSGRMFGIDLLDSFSHLGPHGTHICMVLEPMHQDLAILSRRSHDRKIPLVIVKEIAKQMLLALDYLHTSCNIVHTGRNRSVHICSSQIGRLLTFDRYSTSKYSCVTP